MTWTLQRSEAKKALRAMKTESADSIVTDPSYGISFMGEAWDDRLPEVAHWKECLRVAKKHSFLLAFGHPRTFHRLTIAIEKAGWDIRDCISWIYGQGMPHSKGSLKPAWEPIVVASKGTPHSLQLDGQRIGDAEKGRWPANVMLSHAPDCKLLGLKEVTGSAPGGPAPEAGPAWSGRAGYKHQPGAAKARSEELAPGGKETVEDWACVEGCPVAELDQQSGILRSGSATGLRQSSKLRRTYGTFQGTREESPIEASVGTASRFFWCGKSKSELDRGEGNDHPTVKPVDLMRYLVKLVTPKGGLVLDPFMGSGSTGVAAVMDDFSFWGIDQDPHAVSIADRRLRQVAPLFYRASGEAREQA